MSDVVLILTIVAFFLVAAQLVRSCGGRSRRPGIALVEPSILRRALVETFLKLDPRHMARNPVMFVVEIGSLVTTMAFFAGPSVFVGSIKVWLWATVLFANFAEAVAEGRGKAQAEALRRTRRETTAFVLGADGSAVEVAPSGLRVGDLCVVVAGQIIPGERIVG